MKKLLYLILPLLAANASAQQQPFESNGPKGGQARMFAQQQTDTFVAARGGVYKRMNGAWAPQTSSWNTLSCEQLSAINFSDGMDLLAATTAGQIYHSANFGASWTNISFNLPAGSPYQSVLATSAAYLALHADSGFLYTSTDKGFNWARNMTTGPGKLAYLATRNNIIYLTGSGGLMRSANGGVSFLPQNPSPDLNGRMQWTNDSLWVSGSNGLRWSQDDGMSFSPPLLPGREVGAFGVRNGAILAAVTGMAADTLKYSRDGGASFTNVVLGADMRFGRVFDITADETHFLVGTDRGILYANLNNSGWRNDDSNYRSYQISHLGTAAGMVLATGLNDGIFRSTDSGASWTTALYATHGASDAFSAADGYNSFVYAVGSGFHRSTNGGTSFTTGATGLGAGAFTSLLVDKTNGNVMLVQNGEVYRSTDNGLSFSMLSTGLATGTARSIFRADTSWFIATTSDSLYQAGANLQFRHAGGIHGRPTGVTHNGRQYYASTRFQSLFSSPDGLSWTVVSTSGNIPMNLYAVASIDTNVFVGAENGLVSNASGNWNNDSLQGEIVYSLAVLDRKLYAGTCDGVWARKNIPPVPPADTSLSVGSYRGTLSTLQVYPNPAGGDFRVALHIAEGGVANVSLSDLSGRMVYSQPAPLTAGRNEILVPAGSLQLGSGMYFLKVQLRGQQGIQRILIRGN